MLRFIILALLIFAAAAGGLFARRIYLERTPPAGSSIFYIGANKLTVPKAMVRNPDLREGGGFNRLDLVLRWQELNGLAPATDSNAQDFIFVALEDAAPRIAAPGDIDPAERPTELYARFLGQDAWSNPGGLVMRRFKPGTPYEGEELYLSSLDERAFAARCPNAATSTGPEDLCLWQTRISGLELQVRFAPKYLVQWERLTGNIRALVPKLAVTPVPGKG